MPVDIFALFVAVPVIGLTVLVVYFLSRERAEHTAEAEGTAAKSSMRDKLFKGATWLLALVYIVMGLPKLSGLSNVIHQFDSWGYSQTFMYAVGGIEFLGAIFLLLPRVRLVAAAGISVIMAGAIYTHIAFDPAWFVVLPATCLAMLIFVGYESYRREWSQEGSFRDAARPATGS